MKTAIYKDHIIKKTKTPYQGYKFSAYNYKTDKFINPLYDTLEEIKTVIDNL